MSVGRSLLGLLLVFDLLTCLSFCLLALEVGLSWRKSLSSAALFAGHTRSWGIARARKSSRCWGIGVREVLPI